MAINGADGAPNCAVIIPHFNDHQRLERCLAALMRNQTDGAEIIVVDNCSPVPLDNIAARFPAVRFVTEPTRGAAAARNRGVAETTAAKLFFLDADCIPDADWLSIAQARVAPDSVIGGRIDVFDEGSGPRSGAQAFETVFSFDQRAYVQSKGFSVTANLLTTRAVFNAVGPFVVGVSEDLDWCKRATAQGFHLTYADDLRVSHPTRGDWSALRKKWRRLTDESFELARARPLGRGKWAARALLMPASIAAHTPKVLRSKQLNGRGERWSALGTLARLRLLRATWMLRQAIGV